MARTAAHPLEALTWEDVLAAASRREGDRSFLMRLLQFFCLRHGLQAASLYAPTDDGFERHVATGTEAFPPALAIGQEHDFGTVKLAQGLLLYRAAGGREATFEGPLVLALSAALRAAVLQQRLKQKSFAANYRGVELEALYDVGLAIASMLNLEQLGEEVLLRAVSLLDARRGALYLLHADRYRLEHTLGGSARGELPLGDPQVESLLRSEPPPQQDLLPGAQFLMAVPIGLDRHPKPQGLLLVADKESRRGVGPFPGSDRRTLSLFANQAAIALETAHLHREALEKERLEREVELAADIQRRLLPTRFPKLEGFELAGWSRPARHVGGDFYDLVPTRQDRVAAVLADVSGKGLPAALMVSTLHSALRLLMQQSDIGPQLVKRLNQHVAESSAPNKFITLLLAELNPSDCRVSYVNAGHNPGLLVHPDGGVEELEAGGLPLGLFERSVYEIDTVRLGPGDLLCLYSDGITECSSPRDEEFGVSRFVELLKANREKRLSEIVSTVDRAVVEFAAGANQGDDQTLVLLRRRD